MTALLEMSNAELVQLIKENLELQIGYHFKGNFAKAAFEANCVLFEEAKRRGIVDYSGQHRK